MTVTSLLSFVFLFSALSVKAQYGLEIGFNGGVSYYMGDINYVRQFYHPRHNIGASIKFHFSNRFDLRLGYFNSMLVGNDADFNDIETYGITDMSYLFKGKKDFNGDISKWCVDEVKNMEGMFENAKAFNQDISNWDVSNVVDMSGMFMCASSFNQPIGTWNIKRVCNMSYMFEYATAFNQDLSKWKGMSVNTEDMFVGSGLEGNEPAWYK